MYKYFATVATILMGLLVFQSSAEAARHHRKQVRVTTSAGYHPDCNITMPCAGAPAPFQASVRGPFQPKLYSLTSKGKKHKKWLDGRNRTPPVTHETAAVDVMGTNPYINPLNAVRAMGRGIGGLVAPLAAKVAEIQRDCGSRLISGVRHTRIAGTRTMSLHSSGQAADMQGNPTCIYSKLSNWPGGYTTDYHSAPSTPHVHISYGGFEHGRRFAHGGRGYRTRYARHRGKHYAKRSYKHHYVSARKHRYATASAR